MTCCRCNRKGTCRNCICVREGKSCTSCLPKRLGSCSNVDLDHPSETDETVSDHPSETDETVSESMEKEGEAETTLQGGGKHVHEPNMEDTLPPFSPAHSPDFKSGEMEGVNVVADIDMIYSKIVHWRHNPFKIPSGKQGKVFVQEMTGLFNAYSEASSLEGVAIKAAMVLPALVLQKPSKTSKSKDHSSCIERRMNEWRAGQFQTLYKEAKSIQARLAATRAPLQSTAKARRFAELIMMGKVKAATRLITEESCAGMLPLDQVIEGRMVSEILHEKHPPARPSSTTLPPPTNKSSAMQKGSSSHYPSNLEAWEFPSCQMLQAVSYQTQLL